MQSGGHENRAGVLFAGQCGQTKGETWELGKLRSHSRWRIQPVSAMGAVR